MDKLRETLLRYEPADAREARDREVMLLALDTQPTPLTRDNPIAHFTASAWIVNPARTRVLMAFHNIFRTWSWTGGHADGESDLLAVALREAREETGIADVRPVREGIYSLEILPVPAHVKRGRQVSPHLHLNVTFLLEADDAQPLRAKPDENSDVAWLPPDEAAENREEPFMAVIYRKLNARIPRPAGFDLAPVVARLREASEAEYRALSEKLSPGLSLEVLGVRMPMLRAMAKELCRGDWRGFLEASRSAPVFELRMLHGMVLGGAKCAMEERLCGIDGFLPFVDNWAVCDGLCSSLRPKPAERAALFDFACACAGSDAEFRKRFGLVVLMDARYAQPPYVDRVLDVYRGFDHPGYYARMGAAWGLATLYLRARDGVLDILRAGALDEFTHNKAIQKIQESYRVSPEDKALAKALRRRKERS